LAGRCTFDRILYLLIYFNLIVLGRLGSWNI
jgi:hypothetical protein